MFWEIRLRNERCNLFITPSLTFFIIFHLRTAAEKLGSNDAKNERRILLSRLDDVTSDKV